MKTFLCAMLMLLILVGGMLFYTRTAVSHITEMELLIAALPPTTDAECESAVATLEAVWNRLKPLMRMGAHQSTAEEIELLIVSMRVTSAMKAETEFELCRTQLSALLCNLREIAIGKLWAIL